MTQYQLLLLIPYILYSSEYCFACNPSPSFIPPHRHNSTQLLPSKPIFLLMACRIMMMMIKMVVIPSSRSSSFPPQITFISFPYHDQFILKIIIISSPNHHHFFPESWSFHPQDHHNIILKITSSSHWHGSPVKSWSDSICARIPPRRGYSNSNWAISLVNCNDMGEPHGILMSTFTLLGGTFFFSYFLVWGFGQIIYV